MWTVAQVKHTHTSRTIKLNMACKIAKKALENMDTPLEYTFQHLLKIHPGKNQDSLVSIVARLRTERPHIDFRQGQGFFSPPLSPDHF